MALTTVGFDGTVNETQFARLMRYHGEVAYKHGVVTGFTATAAAGTRQVSITSGTAVLPGLLVDSDATATVSLAANATGANRVDYVVLQADWATNTTSIVVVQGSSSTAPSLTQVSGSLWQMPLARVTVRPSVSTLAAGDVVVCKPLPRLAQYGSDSSMTLVTRAWNSAAFTVATITLPDPGWPYRLQVDACCRFAGGGSINGYGRIYAIANGTELASVASEPLTNPGNHDAQLTRTSAPMSGPVTVLLRIEPSTMSSGSSLTLVTSGNNYFSATQIPA